MAYEIKRFPYDGTIDADGHILEPPDLWENYLEAKYQPRALRIRLDEGGFEYLEIDGKPSQRSRRGSLGLLGAMGEEDMTPRADRRYAENFPYGASDTKQRVDLLERENLDRTLLYPTLGLLWECELTDPELSLAYCRAYNRWIADLCRDSGGRMVPIAMLTLLDPAGSAAELERAAKDGCKGAWVNPFNHLRVPHGDPRHDVLFRSVTTCNVPFAIHPTFTPLESAPANFDWPGHSRGIGDLIRLRGLMQEALFSFFILGTFERFPTLKVGVLEAGSGWIGAILDRIEAMTRAMARARAGSRPTASELFRKHCFISGDPDETAAPLIFDHVGADCFMWATDYPHPDHPHTWVPDLENLVSGLSPETRRKVLGDNVRRVYGLG
jgi:predicted TIM-barrel fold metal-dependent hydrolase